MPSDPVQRVREICLSLPGAEEKPFGGHTAPSFRVRDKLFVIINEDLTRLNCKAPPGAQQVLVGANPERFFVPQYVGHKGWIGIRLDPEMDFDELAGIIAESHAMTAPKPRARR